MKKNTRCEEIYEILDKSESPVSGQILSDTFKVSRQIIVNDIAVLRNNGVQIIATSRGYILDRKKGIRKIIAVKHSGEKIKEELEIIINNGGKVLDVMIEHPVYGELKGEISVSNEEELVKFIALLEGSRAKPLSSISENGVHLHTVEFPDEEKYEKTLKELSEKGFLI